MIEWADLIEALLAGIIIGAVFFGGLWWTVKRGRTSRHPAFLFLGSMAIRTGFCLGAFYLVADRSWQGFLACLLGFLVARLFILRWAPAEAEPLDSESPDPVSTEG